MLVNEAFKTLKEKLSKFCMYLKYRFYCKVITNGFDNEKIREFLNSLMNQIIKFNSP